MALETTLVSVADASISSYAKTTNDGGDALLRMGHLATGSVGIRRVVIKFDLSKLPQKAEIIAAVMKLTVDSNTSNNARTILAYRMKREWAEVQATWNVWSTNNAWQTAGATGTDDIEATPCGSGSVEKAPASGTVVEINMNTGSLQEMLNGTWSSNNGWLLKTNTENADFVRYHSREATEETYRPTLIIDYTAGGRQFQAVWI